MLSTCSVCARGNCTLSNLNQIHRCVHVVVMWWCVMLNEVVVACCHHCASYSCLLFDNRIDKPPTGSCLKESIVMTLYKFEGCYNISGLHGKPFLKTYKCDVVKHFYTYVKTPHFEEPHLKKYI